VENARATLSPRHAPSGKAFYVTGMAAGAVALQNADTGALLTRDFSELEPMDMVWSAVKPAAAEDGEPPSYQARLFVASGGSIWSASSPSPRTLR